MARSQYIWLVVYENGNVDFVKAQTIFQILECDELSKDSDSIMFINRIELAGYSDYNNIIEIPFRD